MLATFPAQDAPRCPQDAPRCPTRTGYDAIWCPLGLLLGSIIFGMPLGIDFLTVLAPFWLHFGRFLEDFWKIFWKNLPSNLPPQTYFRKKPASTNSLSKKASQNLRGRRCSPQALAIRRPPACLGCKSVFRTQGQIWPILGLERPPRIRRGLCHYMGLSAQDASKMPPRRLQDAS